MLPPNGNPVMRRYAQLHDRGITERLIQLSGDPSATHPSVLETDMPITPVMDLTRYQQQTLILRYTGPSAASSLFQLAFDEAPIQELFQKARQIRFGSVGWAYSNVASTITVGTTLNLLCSDEQGTTTTIPVNNLSLSWVNRPSPVYINATERLVDFDRMLVHEVGASTPPQRLFPKSIVVIFNRTVGSATFVVQDVAVPVQLLF